MNKTLRFSLLTMLVMLFCGIANADTYYQKVTATTDITNGKYLIVYEDDNVAFDGGLTTLDAVSNTVAVTITDGKIASSATVDAAVFDIDVTNGRLKSARGLYIGVSSNSNGLKQIADESAYTNAFSIDASGNAVISAVFNSSTMSLRYNKASNQTRFRYYKDAGQQPIQLYKQIVEAAPAEDVSVYVDPVGNGTWMADNAKISLNVYTDGQSNNAWINGEELSGGVLKFTFADTYNRMIIVRGSTANDWDAKWNQSEDITYVADKLYKANGYDNGKLAYTVTDYSEPVAAGYVVDFNTAITTSAHDFAVASNWRHIVGSYTDDYSDTYYMSYSYGAATGANGEGDGALLANRQYAGDYSGGMTIQDYLITPVVKGKVTLDIKASTLASSTNGAYVEVYAVNADGTIGNLIKKISDDIAGANSGYNTAWATFELADLSESQRIALRCQYVYIDNFKATEATIVPEPKLTITAVTKATDASSIYFDQQQDGTLLVKMYVTLQNNGDVDFVAGTTENYTLSVLQKPSYGASHGPYGAFAIPVDLAKGETSEPILVSVSVPAAEVSSLSTWSYWYVIENVTGTQSSASLWASFNKYESKLIFREVGSTSTSSLTSQNWGAITEETVKNYEIANTGSAPLVIKGHHYPEGFNVAIDYVNLPDGVTVDPITQYVTINGGAALQATVTVPATPYGSFSGNFMLTYRNALAEEDTEFSCAFSVNVINANTWKVDFNNTTSTIIYPEGVIAEAGITNDYQYISSGNYNNWIKGYTSSSYETKNNKFITPKLHANAGDKLSFDVKAGYSNNDAYFVKVYKSTDRVNWGDPVATYVYSTVTSNFTAQSITFDEAGDYYVAFALYGTGSGVDNIVGLEKVAVAHDLYMKEVIWPDASVKSGTALIKPSFDIIPLTNEAAENYTVKYVCGETVLAEADAKALTASAKSTTGFSFSWTPTVENTTVYKGTKVVIEFTDNTKFESEPFDLTVTNEAIFHFLDSKPSSQWNEPTDRTAPISFGKLHGAATPQSFVIFNWGSLDLTVNSISLPEGFTTDAEFPFNVAAFNGENVGIDASCKTLSINFTGTAPGTYSGNMVITYSGDKTFTLPVSAILLDQSKFYANFGAADNQWPAGSVYQSNVITTYVNTGDYAITSSSSTKNIFVTPKLSAQAGDKLLFDAKLYNTNWGEGKVVVYAAGTRDEILNFDPENDTRTPLFTISGTQETNPMTTDYHTYEVVVPEAGDYFFGFEISGRPYVDELYGLTPVAVAHDWMIASSNIPAEGMQNVASTATVNILNLGLADEAADSYTVTAYVDGVAVGTGTAVALPTTNKLSDAGTQLTVSFKSPKVGTFPVYIEVKAGDYSVATEPVDVTFAEEVAKSEATATADGASLTTPLNLSYYNSESVSLFTSDVLTNSYGLANGAKIKSITFKGYKTDAATTSTFNVWYEWTDDAAQTKPADGLYTTAGLTQIVTDQEKTWPKEGSSSNMVDFITLNFDEPLVYQSGKSLRIVMRSNSTQWKAAYFERATSATNDLAYYHFNDTESTFKTNSWSSSRLPVLHIGLVVEPTILAGTVKNAENAAVEGATVTLVSTDGDNIQYTGTTDAEGAYSINVIQNTREYEVRVEKEGFVALTKAADLTQANDFVLLAPGQLTGTVKNGEGVAIAGAAVKLGDYETTTDETGAYTISNIDPYAAYSMTVTAEGYADATAEISFAEGNVEKNIEMFILKTIWTGEVDLANWTNSIDLNTDLFKKYAEAGEKVRITIDNKAQTREFTNNANWTKVNFFAWDKNGDAVTEAWPGNELTEKASNGNYTFAIPANAVGIIFNDGEGTQTYDITELNHSGYYTSDKDNETGKFWYWHWDNTAVQLQDAAWVDIEGAKAASIIVGTEVVDFDITEAVLAKLTEGDFIHVKGTAATVSKVELLMKAPKYDISIAENIQNGAIQTNVSAAAKNATVIITATPAAGYTLEAVAVNGTTADLVVETTKVDDTHYTFVMPNEAVTVSATFAQKLYSTSINIEQMVLDQSKKFDIAAALTEHNIAFENINELDSLNDAKNLRNEPFLGLKVKTAGGFIKVLLQKGKALNVKFGQIKEGNPVKVSIDGAEATDQTELIYQLAAAEADREVTFTTSSAQTVVFKQIMIGEDIAAVTLPAQEFDITKTAATNGTYTVKVDDAEVEKATEGTVVTIAATPAEGYELDAIKVINGETEVTVNADGAFTMPAAAVTITVTFKQTVVDGIFGIKADGTVDGEAYTLDGVRIEKLQKGKVNIIRTKDGKIRRIFVK